MRTERNRAEAHEAARIAGVAGLPCLAVPASLFATGVAEDRAFRRAARAAVPITWWGSDRYEL